MKNKKFAAKQVGASLIEFMAYTALAAAVVFAAVMGYRAATSGNTTTQTIRELSSIRSGMQSVRGVAADYSGITMAILNTAKVVPSTLTVSGSNASSQSGIVYAIDTTTAPAVPTINVTMPSDVCTKVLPAIDGSWANINGTALPLGQAAINTTCTAGSTVTVKFAFS